MKPKPFEIIVEFTPQSTKTGITYEAHQKGSLIRCKDCKSWRKSYFESVNEMVCNKTRYIMKPDGYCSMAKRKEE